MKKIAIVASGLLWATGIFADGVSSQEIVGYQTRTIKAGFSLNTPTFTDVGSDGIDLSKFKLLNAAGDGTEVIQVLDENGMNNETWTWLNENAGMKEGWYDEVSWEPISGKINPGNGYLMNVAADVVVSVSGAVKADKTIVDLPVGFKVVGNSTPDSIDLQSIKILNGAGDGTEVIQVLDENGINNETWAWLNENAGMKEGWYDEVSWEPINKTVDPGSAFLFNVATDTKVEIPAALK